jgi:hypothetical protein
MGERQFAGQALHLFGRDGVAVQPKAPGLLERGQMAGCQRDAGGGGHFGCRPVEPRRFGVAGIDDDRSELDARLVLEGVGRLDRLGDRQFLGEGDEDDPGPGRVREQIDHVLRLGA